MFIYYQVKQLWLIILEQGYLIEKETNVSFYMSKVA